MKITNKFFGLLLATTLAACGGYTPKSTLTIQASATALAPYASAQFTVTQHIDGGSDFDVTKDAAISETPSTGLAVAGNLITANGFGGATTITAAYQGQTASIAIAAASASQINCLGDSLSQGVGTSNNTHTYCAVLQQLLQRKTKNFGIGGQTSTEIALRDGAIVAQLATASGTIEAAGTGTSITAINGVPIIGTSIVEEPDYRFLSTASDSLTRAITGTYAGFRGALTRSAIGDANSQNSTSETYVFTQDVGGILQTVGASALFVPDPLGSPDDVLIIWAGRNNLHDVAQIEADTAAMAAHATNGKYLVISNLNGAGEGTGTVNYAQIVALDAYLKALYADRYIDARGSLVQAYDPSSAQDTLDHAADIPPSSLRSDAIHLDDAGYLIVAKLVAATITQKGY